MKKKYKKSIVNYYKKDHNKQGNTEKIESLKSKLSELAPSISPEEKNAIDLRIKEKIRQEENYRMQKVEEREGELSKKIEKNEKFKEIRQTVESNLIKSGKLNETEHTIAREDGEFETIVDKEAREQQILDEMKRIEAEQNGQGGLKL